MKYQELCGYYQKLESTSKRLNKTYIIADLLKKVSSFDLDTITLLVQGKVFPTYDDRKIGVASKMVVKAIMVATGLNENKVVSEWKLIGDIGETAEKLCCTKKQRTLFSQSLTVKKVFENIKKIAEQEGPGSTDVKIKLLAELLGNAKCNEAKYIVRTILEDLRVGVKQGTLRDAIVWAFYPPIIPIFIKCNNCKKVMPKIEKCLECGASISVKDETKYSNVLNIEKFEDINKKKLTDYDYIVAKDEKVAREVYNWLVGQVDEAIDLTNDYGTVASRAKSGNLESLFKIGLVPGTPLKVMLFLKAKDMEDAFKQVGTPTAVEYKYDGFRIQVHRNGKEVKLFTRRLEDVTRQFPDVVEVVKTHIKSHDYILDGEIVGMDPETKVHIPFQEVSQRIKRKHNIHEMVKKVPVELHIFDVMEINGENYLKKMFKDRRDKLEEIIKPVKHQILLAEQIVTSSVDEAKKFYQRSLEDGQEGVMVKNLESPYKPGARVGYGIKVKPVMESLDLVIVGATWGEGKRSDWLSSFDLACKKGDEFVNIGKVGTGVKEKSEEGLSFEELTKILKPLIVKEEGRRVEIKPEIIIEINFEEVQKSPTYSSGYALRFPRVIRLRPDKPLSEVSTIKLVERLYREQRGRG